MNNRTEISLPLLKSRTLCSRITSKGDLDQWGSKRQRPLTLFIDVFQAYTLKFKVEYS